ncbi:hypothetical protein, partial [Pantoea stewartii]|uniref:hypothetical protein n=1 Tax=Pantoea stewartii TaxID=66269 RepID=UPI001B870B79
PGDPPAMTEIFAVWETDSMAWWERSYKMRQTSAVPATTLIAFRTSLTVRGSAQWNEITLSLESLV